MINFWRVIVTCTIFALFWFLCGMWFMVSVNEKEWLWFMIPIILLLQEPLYVLRKKIKERIFFVKTPEQYLRNTSDSCFFLFLKSFMCIVSEIFLISYENTWKWLENFRECLYIYICKIISFSLLISFRVSLFPHDNSFRFKCTSLFWQCG